MARSEFFDSLIRSQGDIAGVFEYDGDVGYFYLYNMSHSENQRVIGAIRVLAGAADIQERDIVIRWDHGERLVGLFLKGHLVAAFDSLQSKQFGGIDANNADTTIPLHISRAFTQ